MSSIGATIPPSHDQDPFPYGWREVERRRPDGTVYWEQQALGPEAFLDPQPGDVMIQGALHAQIVLDLYARLTVRFQDRPTTAVFHDLKMLWGIPGLKEPAPDISVIHGVSDRDAPRESFDCLAEGVRPSLVIEVMSRNYAGDDTRKPAIYAHAGIPEYLIIKPYGKRMRRELSLWGHRLVGSGYRPWKPDPDGWLVSNTVGVAFRADATRQAMQLIDARTGTPLRSVTETHLACRRAEQRADAAESRISRLEALLRSRGIDPDAQS
jgi:Uma2 family endonuclease